MSSISPAEEYIEKFYQEYFETDEWKDLQEYTKYFKEMYFKELDFLRSQFKYSKLNEEELAVLAIRRVNELVDKVIKDLGDFIIKLQEY